MEHNDLVKWTVKNGLFRFKPYTSVQIETLSIQDDTVRHTIGARNVGGVGRAYYNQDTHYGATWNTGAVMRLCCLDNTNIVADFQTGFFQAYSTDDIRDFHRRASRVCGSAVLPHGVTDKLVSRIMWYCDTYLEPGWKRHQMMRYIQMQVDAHIRQK